MVKRVFHHGSGPLNDFNRQREATELLDLLRFVGNDNKAFRCVRDTFFAQKFAAASLDQCETWCDFVGAVDGEVQTAALFEREERYSIASAEVFAVFRTGDCADLQAMVAHAFAEKLDPERRGGSGAQSKGHSRFNELERALSGVQLQTGMIFRVLYSHGV